MLFAVLWCCMWGVGDEREQWRMLHSLPYCSHSLCYPQSNWAPLVLIPEWVGLCMLQAPVGLSKELFCEAGSFSHCHLNPYRCFQSEVWGFISPRWSLGLRGLFRSPTIPPSLSMWECGAAGSASCSLACPVPQSATSLGQMPPCLESSPPLLPVSAPPTGLDEWFFFISLVFRLPYSLIFCQFLLFFVFKLLLSFFWLCEAAQCVYLHLHLGRKLLFIFF